jgi:uroporphyrinogen-III synthase
MRVVFTRLMPADDLALCQKLKIEPVVVPLITTEGIPLEEIFREYPNFWPDLSRVTAVAFTSQHAVDALLGSLAPLRSGLAGQDVTGEGTTNQNQASKIRDILRKKPVYTVGEVTADALDMHGIMARFPEDYNGTVLAEMMQYDGVHSSVMHFCGTMRRPEFYDAMTASEIDVISVEVYRKGRAELVSESISHTPFSLPDDIEAVAFYSPSAVHAFWDFNLHRNFGGSYFAIGSTTLNALKSHGFEAQIPRVPTSELLIRKIALYLNEQRSPVQ